MAKRSKQYAREFVARAVRLCDESDRPITEVARDLGVEYATLYGWMKKAGKTEARKRQSGTPVEETPMEMRAELDRVRRELEEVKKERDFLKKAAAFFANQHK